MSETGTTTASSEQTEAKTFTQDELNQTVEERLRRERAKFQDYSDLKKKAEEFDKLAEAQKSEAEKAIAQARKEASEAAGKEATAKANARILRAEVKAIAGGKLADPSDAVRLLDLSEFSVDDDGEVDAKAITKAVDQLLKEKPYLAADARPGTGSADGGARGTSSAGADMNSLLRRAAGRG